jgi:hypothetical protein
MTKTKAIRMPGKERPAASQSRIQRPPTPELHHKNPGKDTKPSDKPARKPTAEGLDRRFFRSQPRVIDPGSLRKARPRRSEYYPNTQLPALNINASLLALHGHTPAR